MNRNDTGPRRFAPILIVPVLVALILTLFAWPQTELEPRDLPVGLAGPGRAVAPVERALERDKGAFESHRFSDVAGSRAAIEDREIYAAVVPGPRGATLLTASAASPTVAQALVEVLRPARVIDVVPADSDDPRGAAFNSSVLPVIIVGLLAGVLVFLEIPRGMAQFVALAAAALLAGLAAVAVIQGWLGVIEGSWLANATVLGLTVAAIAAAVAGCAALMGPAGIGVAALLMVLIGNPWSGIASAPELLPQPVGTIGQLLPPGAGGNALRSTAFFDGARVWDHLAVLIGWTLLGVTAMAVGLWRSSSSAQSFAPSAGYPSAPH